VKQGPGRGNAAGAFLLLSCRLRRLLRGALICDFLNGTYCGKKVEGDEPGLPARSA